MVSIFWSIAKVEGELWDEAAEYAGISTTVTKDLKSMAYCGTFVGFEGCMKGLRGGDKLVLHRR
jgi:hypothetical protein